MEEGSQTGHRIEGYLEKCGIIDTLRHALAQVGRCIYMNPRPHEHRSTCDDKWRYLFLLLEMHEASQASYSLQEG